MSPRRSPARLLLRLYPAEFRRRFGDEFVAFAEERRREAAGQGAAGALRVWAELAADVLRSAPAAHARALAGALAARLRARHDHRFVPLPTSEDVMDTLRQDLRFAFRSLGRRPGFTLVVAATLALGIGANTAIFSVVNAVLLQRLPWPAAERLVDVEGRTAEGEDAGASYPDFLAWRAGVPAFEEVGVVRGQTVNLTGVERPDRLYGLFASASILRVLGATTAVGRLFADAETEVGTKASVAVLSHDTWQTRFGGDPGIVGRAVTLNGQPFTVVGVLRRDFVAPRGGADVWIPIPYYPNAGGLERGDRSMGVVARLRAGVAPEAALAQASAVVRREAERHPQPDGATGAGVRTMREVILGGERQPLALVMAAVGVLLLIACLNVANLQLARAIGRGRETSVRAALGASRSRLVRQLLTESLVLAALGGALGVLLGHLLLGLLVRLVGGELPAFGGIAIDGRVLLAAAAATITCGVLFGLVPAWQAARGDVGAGLGTRGGGASAGAMRGRSVLAVGQMALCVVLLATAGLLARTLRELERVRPGFDPANLLTFEFRLPPAKYDTPEKIAGMFERAVAEMRAVPGVRAAALVRAVPFGGNREMFPVAFDGRALDEASPGLQVHVNVVSDGYFVTAGIPLRAGRDFEARDDARAPMVAVVNEVLARRAWPGESPIGKRLRAGPWERWATVVGVATGAKHVDLAAPVQPQAYVHFRQMPLIFTGAVVRTAGDPMALAEAVRQAVWRVDPDQPMWKVRSMERMLAGSVGAARTLATLTVAFALVALGLAAVGVLGVMSFLVAQRRREMGIRIALGARGAQVTAMVVRHGLRLTAVALVLGVVGAVGAGRLVAGQLYGVAPSDPVTLGAVAALLAAASLAACWVPARRAGRVDPTVSLREE